MLLLALGTTFFFEGVARPGDLQRAIGTVLIGATLMLTLYAAELPSRLLRVAAALILTIVAGVVIASVAGNGMTVAGIAAIANGRLVGLRFRPLCSGSCATCAHGHGHRHHRRRRALPLPAGGFVLRLHVRRPPEPRRGSVLRQRRGRHILALGLLQLRDHDDRGLRRFTARSNLGHTLAVSEALLGQIYLVTVVAAIVSRMVPRGALPK